MYRFRQAETRRERLTAQESKRDKNFQSEMSDIFLESLEVEATRQAAYLLNYGRRFGLVFFCLFASLFLTNFSFLCLIALYTFLTPKPLPSQSPASSKHVSALYIYDFLLSFFFENSLKVRMPFISLFLEPSECIISE